MTIWAAASPRAAASRRCTALVALDACSTMDVVQCTALLTCGRTGPDSITMIFIFAELLQWAEQGVLLLNTVLTVRAHTANSHAKKVRTLLSSLCHSIPCTPEARMVIVRHQLQP